MESSHSNPSAPILQMMTLEEIIWARLERPYNLPTDLETFPTFGSFEERYEFIQRSLLQLYFRELNRQIREEANESDTSTDESEDERGSAKDDWEDEHQIDRENIGNTGRNERPHLVHSLQFLQLGISWGQRHGFHGGYGRGSGGEARGEECLDESLKRPFTDRTLQPRRTLELGEIPDGVEDVSVDIEGDNMVEDDLVEFRVVNLAHRSASLPPSTPTNNPRKRRHPEESSLGRSWDRAEPPWDCSNRAESLLEDGRNNASSSRETWDNASSSRETRDNASSSREIWDNPLRRQAGDVDSPESSVGNRGVIANVGLLPTNSIESTSPSGEGKVWPRFERPIAFNPSPDEKLRAKEKETTLSKKPKTKPLTWADVHSNLPAISGGEVQSPEDYRDKWTNFQQIKREEFMLTILSSSHPNRKVRAKRVKQLVKDKLDSLEVTFVGENCPMQKFLPWRGDLIIALRNGRPRPSYLESYTEELGHDFSNGELVLRIGHFEKLPPILFPNDFEYNPHTKVELYAFNQMDTSPPTKWKFLGNQNELDNAPICHPPYESPGKFVKVGTQLLDSNTEFEPIVPRRGDVIIKREAWEPSYHHNANFWYSMVKWHRGTQFPFVAGDMLVRRFIDNQYKEQNSLNIPRNPLLWGWAELYEYHNFHNWIFWGRTKHCYDVPLDIDDTIFKNYTCDDGEDSEEDMDFEIINPRLDAS